MPLATKNNAIIVKDGKVAENCGCCGGWTCYGPDACSYLLCAQSATLTVQAQDTLIHSVAQLYPLGYQHPTFGPCNRGGIFAANGGFGTGSSLFPGQDYSGTFQMTRVSSSGVGTGWRYTYPAGGLVCVDSLYGVKNEVTIDCSTIFGGQINFTARFHQLQIEQFILSGSYSLPSRGDFECQRPSISGMVRKSFGSNRMPLGNDPAYRVPFTVGQTSFTTTLNASLDPAGAPGMTEILVDENACGKWLLKASVTLVPVTLTVNFQL